MGVRSGPKLPDRGQINAMTEDGTFNTSSGWTVTPGSLGDSDNWSISNGVATIDGSQSGTRWMIMDLPQNNYYKVIMTITRTAGTLSLSYGTGGATSGTEMTNSGKYTHGPHQVTGNNILYIRADSSFSGTITDVKVIQTDANGVPVSHLLMSLDAMNAKSFAGEPADNLYGDMSTSSNLRPSRTEYHTETNWSVSAPKPPEPIGRVYKHTSGALTSTWSGNSYGYTLKDLSTTNGATYILTCWVYLSPDCDITALPMVIEQETSESSVTGFNTSYDTNQKGTWQLLAKKCVADDLVRFIPIYPRKNGVTDGSFTGFYMWGGVMVHKNDHVVPWGYGDRSVTNAWKDLSGNGNHGSFSAIGFGDSGDTLLGRRGEILLPIGEHGKTQKEADLEHTDGGVASGAVASINFDGTNDLVTTSFGNGRNPSTNPITYSFWVVQDGSGSDMFAVQGNWGSSSRAYFGVLSGYWNMGIHDDGWGDSASTRGPAVVIGKWTNVVIVFDGSAAKMYVNGLHYWDRAYSSYTFNQVLEIGGNTYDDGGTNYSWNGRIAKVSVFNAALSHEQVKQEFNQFKVRFGL